jgi:hypothetical protein
MWIPPRSKLAVRGKAAMERASAVPARIVSFVIIVSFFDRNVRLTKCNVCQGASNFHRPTTNSPPARTIAKR